MRYDGPEKIHRAATPEEQFNQDVNGLARRVLLENIPLDSIRVDEGVDREQIIQAVQQRIIRLFAEIKHRQKKLGDTEMIHALRERIANVFNIQEERLPPINSILPPSGKENSPVTNKADLKEYFEKELFSNGKLYLSPGQYLSLGEHYFEAAKEAILSKFVIRCQSSQQQEDVEKIIDKLKVSDLTLLGVSRGFSVIEINPEVFDELTIASLMVPSENYMKVTKSSPRVRSEFVYSIIASMENELDEGWDFGKKK